jgi:hypothetical protein
MSSTLRPTHSEFSAGLSATEPSVDAALRPANPKNVRFPSKRPSLGRRASRALARFLITFCMVWLPPWLGSPTATRPER